MIEKSLTPRERHFRHEVPKKHRLSLDTRLAWLWKQRFGTVQKVWLESEDPLDRTAATVLLQCVLARDLESIKTLFYRLEGPPLTDAENLDRAESEGPIDSVNI